MHSREYVAMVTPVSVPPNCLAVCQGEFQVVAGRNREPEKRKAEIEIRYVLFA